MSRRTRTAGACESQTTTTERRGSRRAFLHCRVAPDMKTTRQEQPSMRTTTQLSLQTRKSLAVAAMTLRAPVPAVFVTASKVVGAGTKMVPLLAKAAKAETLEQAELRRERVESITRRAPEVVITRRWIHTANDFDAQSAVVMKLPLLTRLMNWLRSDLA